MCTCSQAEVLAVLPVDQVVAATTPRSCPVRDLIMFVSRRCEPILRPLVLLRLRVAVRRRDAAAGDVAGERRAILDGQRVCRDVVRRQGDGHVQRALPRRELLLRKSIDQIDVDGAEAEPQDGTSAAWS